VKLVAAALLAFVLGGGSDDSVVSRLHVRFDERDLVVRSCVGVVGTGSEVGLATIQYRYHTEGTHVLADGEYTGTVVFELGDIVVEVPRSISWPQMTATDRLRAEALRRAIIHHEIGHVRIAEQALAELNAHTTTVVEPNSNAFRTEMDAVGHAGFERFMSEERAYDALTDHGRRQHVAPPPFAGPDTSLQCGQVSP